MFELLTNETESSVICTIQTGWAANLFGEGVCLQADEDILSCFAAILRLQIG